jgi:predicted nucleotidyltransferase
MDMRDEWLTSLRTWATNNGNVQELWLFGSRAKDNAQPDSDIDIALALMPPDGKHNWALAAYIQFF